MTGASQPDVGVKPRHEDELARGERFRFGANWARFLKELDDQRIADAEGSLKQMLGTESLSGKRFLDAGSGSGLFSLAARRLGARVHSFDYDPQSVECTQELRRRYFPDDDEWTVEEGSVLDSAYLDGLGKFEVVYSWGVLHHTGAMWDALGNILPLVAPEGQLFIALYNQEGIASRYWWWVKKLYVKVPLLRPGLVLAHVPYPFLPAVVSQTLRPDGRRRGMAPWHDLIDWIGGFPFEVARPEEVVEFCSSDGFLVERLRTTNRLGCNEFVLKRHGGGGEDGGGGGVSR